LIALGGSVRIMKAGLACPDWPLCFGDVIPDYHPQVYFEFIHRVVAGSVTIATLFLFWVLVKSEAPKAVKRLAFAAIGLLFTQVVFGGLTVLLQLQSNVVAAHLGMGTGFFALLLWIYLSVKQTAGKIISEQPAWLMKWALLVVLAVYGQIILGGLVASHFASLVCPDFPTCYGEWFPTFHGIIGLHMIHRLGAYSIFALTLANWFLFSKKSFSPILGKFSLVLFALVCCQIAIGIANVIFRTPPLIAVAHLATATAALSMTIRQVNALYYLRA
jgi:cytochrome c oxidase assembly protein subunit 15